VIRRKELLELVLEKMEGVRDLESQKRDRERGRGKTKGGKREEKKGWW
jgi:hypothetical protein